MEFEIDPAPRGRGPRMLPGAVDLFADACVGSSLRQGRDLHLLWTWSKDEDA